jgi:D-arginine dehydrogenase
VTVSRYDVAIVGGGIAGASAGYFLATAGAAVVVLEREATCGYHSTGRSAAIFTECYGLDPVRRLAIAGRPFLEEPPDGFDGPLLRDRQILFAGSAAQTKALDDLYEDSVVLVPSVQRLDAAATLERCPSLRPDVVTGGMAEPGAMDIDVHALLDGYLRGIRAAGGEVRTNAEVIALASDGGGWRVVTAVGTVAVETVVNAAGAWCDRIAALGGVTPIGLVPKRRTAFTFDPPPGVDHTAWPLVIDAEERFYFKPEGPHLLGSPADETPHEPADARHDELDVAVAIDRIQGVLDIEIRHVRHAWAGLRSFVADKLLVAGFDPDHPGFFWLAGQGGYGIKTSPAMGALTAGLILEGAEPSHLRAAGVSAAELAPGRLRATA